MVYLYSNSFITSVAVTDVPLVDATLLSTSTLTDITGKVYREIKAVK